MISLPEVILSVLGFACVWIFLEITREIKRLRQGIEELNIKIAVVCEQVSGHEKRISSLEER